MHGLTKAEVEGWTKETEHSLLVYAKKILRKYKGYLGIEPLDLLHTSWIVWKEGKDKGWSDERCAARARKEMYSVIRDWRGDDWDHRTGKRLTYTFSYASMNLFPNRPTLSKRTRLPHKVRKALSKLTKEQREVLRFAFVEGWTPTIAAEVSGWKFGTVASRKNKTLHHLRGLCGILCS